LNDVLASVVVSQAELFAAAARQLEDVIALLPPDRVAETRAAIQKVIGQGGVQTAKPAEKTALQKGLAIVTGKAVPSDFRKDENLPPARTSVGNSRLTGRSSSMTSVPTASLVTKANSAGVGNGTAPQSSSASNPFAANGNPFSLDEDFSVSPKAGKAASSPSFAQVASAVAAGRNVQNKWDATPTAPPPPFVPQPSQAQKVTVVALYDHDAEADDELSFGAGDIVEVLETSDDGWWKGRCKGKVGLFPVNYVQA
jgi:hypothetical protein